MGDAIWKAIFYILTRKPTILIFTVLGGIATIAAIIQAPHVQDFGTYAASGYLQGAAGIFTLLAYVPGLVNTGRIRRWGWFLGILWGCWFGLLAYCLFGPEVAPQSS